MLPWSPPASPFQLPETRNCLELSYLGKSGQARFLFRAICLQVVNKCICQIIANFY